MKTICVVLTDEQVVRIRVLADRAAQAAAALGPEGVAALCADAGIEDRRGRAGNRFTSAIVRAGLEGMGLDGVEAHFDQDGLVAVI